jgi:hypothetical protein
MTIRNPSGIAANISYALKGQNALYNPCAAPAGFSRGHDKENPEQSTGCRGSNP